MLQTASANVVIAPGTKLRTATGATLTVQHTQHKLGPQGSSTIVHASTAQGPRFKGKLTKRLRTLLKLGVERDTLLVCVDPSSKPKSESVLQGCRIYLAELAYRHTYRTDADYVRHVAELSHNAHPDVEVVLVEPIAKRKKTKAIRRLARGLAALGFTVLWEDKTRKRDHGLHLRVGDKRRRLVPVG
jgi:hypothetical protein